MSTWRAPKSVARGDLTSRDLTPRDLTPDESASHPLKLPKIIQMVMGSVMVVLYSLWRMQPSDLRVTATISKR